MKRYRLEAVGGDAIPLAFCGYYGFDQAVRAQSAAQFQGYTLMIVEDGEFFGTALDEDPAGPSDIGDGYYLPQDDATRKNAPMFRGLLAYFPAALFEVAAHSLDNDRKHNPDRADGEYAPTWAKGKSGDHEDTIARHLIEAGPRRSLWAELGSLVPSWLREKLPGYSAKDARRYHLRAIAWRALALLQEDCEADGAAWGSSARGEKPAGE